MLWTGTAQVYKAVAALGCALVGHWCSSYPFLSSYSFFLFSSFSRSSFCSSFSSLVFLLPSSCCPSFSSSTSSSSSFPPPPPLPLPSPLPPLPLPPPPPAPPPPRGHLPKPVIRMTCDE